MKNRVIFLVALFTFLLLACYAPLTINNSDEITAVSVSPHSGSGIFNAVVEGQVTSGKSILICSISDERLSVSKEVYRKALLSPSKQLTHAMSFVEEFSFTYTQSGNHYLVCKLNEYKSWSDSFIVIQPEDSDKTSTPSPTLAIIATPTLTSTPTKPTLLKLKGTFTLPESYIKCGDNSRSPYPASAVTGLLELFLDYSTGTVEATLVASSGDVVQVTCGNAPYTMRYEIEKSTISGTFDPNLSEFTLSGEVKYGFWNSCYLEGDSICTGGGQSHLPIEITMTINVNRDDQTATGKIKRMLFDDNWGDWQAK